MAETFFYHGSRDSIKARTRELVSKGNAPGKRPDSGDDSRRQREIARAQLLFMASKSLGLGISYRDALTSAQGVRLCEPLPEEKEQ